MIGRDREIDLLRLTLATAVSGAGVVVFIVGEAGIGKSRLVREVSAMAAAGGARVLRGRAVQSSEHVAFRPIAEALAAAVEWFADDPDLSAWAPVLGRIVPGSTSSPLMANGDSPAAWGEAVVRALGLLGRQHGALLILEDLHWSDPETLSIVDHLCDHIVRTSVLCVATVRSEAASPGRDLARAVAARRGGIVIELSRLEDDDVGMMIDACSSDTAAQQRSRIVEAADGVPFLVEELLASPGMPVAFRDSVADRMATLDRDGRAVLSAAATFGRRFDWRLLPATTGLTGAVVSHSLELGVELQLLRADAEGFSFRHSLTREAVLDGLLPPRRAQLAADAFSALTGARPLLAGSLRDTAAMLAEQAGDAQAAGSLYAQAGREAITAGALVSAMSSLRRAHSLLAPGDQHDAAAETLVSALAQAGHVDEALGLGGSLAERISHDRAASLHLQLAKAAIAGTRWPVASDEICAARASIAHAPSTVLDAELAVCEAEIALGANRVADGLERAEVALALARTAGAADVECEALLLIGRGERATSLERARAAFAASLALATRSDLTVARLHAAHELGTIDLLDRGDLVTLREARALAVRIGALSTVAALDVELAAGCSIVGDIEAMSAHAQQAATLAGQLGIPGLVSIAMHFCALAHVLRDDEPAMRAVVRSASAASPAHQQTQALAAIECEGLLALLRGDRTGASTAMARGLAMIGDARSAAPATGLGLAPLVLCAHSDSQADRAVAELGASGVLVNRVNRGYLEYCRAIQTARRGDRDAALVHVGKGDANLRHGPLWWHLGRWLLSEAARTDRWGTPEQWTTEAADFFVEHGSPAVATAIRGARPLEQMPAQWVAWGLTPREAEVLALVVAGASNKEIAAALYLSVRTVEKHVESLLRKCGARTRARLAAAAAGQITIGPP